MVSLNLSGTPGIAQNQRIKPRKAMFLKRNGLDTQLDMRLSTSDMRHYLQIGLVPARQRRFRHHRLR
jgi:hypothetical protein